MQPAEADSTERFTGKAAEYAQFRERYDAAFLLPWLRASCGLTPEWLIADVGAGTGMVGDVFLANGNRVIAIEPNAEMRAACAALHGNDDRLILRDGTAEQTGLADASISLIAVGRAMHWFRLNEAMNEFRRILAPEGWIFVVSCGRTEDIREENLAFAELMHTHADRDRSAQSGYEVYGALKNLFAGGEFHHGEQDGTMQLDWEQLRGLTLSNSHAPMPGSTEFPTFEATLRNYFSRFAHDGRITLATRTWANAGRFAR